MSEHFKRTRHPSYPEVVRVFRHEFDARRKDRMNLQAGTADVDKETLEVFRSLGYVR